MTLPARVTLLRGDVDLDGSLGTLTTGRFEGTFGYDRVPAVVLWSTIRTCHGFAVLVDLQVSFVRDLGQLPDCSLDRDLVPVVRLAGDGGAALGGHRES